ncbi:MAG: xylose isomerase [Planctomycetaceae bacterium]|nr:xylose isomerase [Planctomycetaceae bacterium]
MTPVTRRDWITATGGALVATSLPTEQLWGAPERGSKMEIGLVTYLWAHMWDLDTCLKNCEAAEVLGIELRSTHGHGVEPSLNSHQRAEVKKKFGDSPVTCLGPGSNERYDNPDPAVVKKAIEATKDFLQLSHDIGSSGVKVKPDRFRDEMSREKTIEQIGKSLHHLAHFADDLGQELRLEVHNTVGKDFAALAQIMEIADHPRAVLCWNSNPADFEGDGLQANFNAVKDYFGQTAHIHELQSAGYPYQDLMNLLVAMDYSGWLLLECTSKITDPVAALSQQREIFHRLIAKAQVR